MKRTLWIWLGAGALLLVITAGAGTGEIGCAGVLAIALAGVVGHAAGPRSVAAGLQTDTQGRPAVFTLTWDRETITLDAGKSWLRVDVFKWATRGILDQPQSFHVAADGTVEINGERIHPGDADGVLRLETEINKHAALPGAASTVAAEAHSARPAAPVHRKDRVEYHVKLDRMGHLMIECFRGEDRTETGIRGLPALVENGLMLKPAQFHLDPLQRHVEVDGLVFECSETGAKRLEELLNTRYAPAIKDGGENLIEVRENSASPTGFDLHFVAMTSGTRAPVKGHLSQELLDLLQDDHHCGLLVHGVLVRLSPPYLLVRRRRADGGEERIPELPDTQYSRATAAQLQQMLNHPLVRRGGSVAVVVAGTGKPSELVALRVQRHPQNKLLLWIECVSNGSGPAEGRAFTHHNLADMQHEGVFRPNLEVSLSLNNQRLAVLNHETGSEECITLGPDSADEVLTRASQLLTASLKPAAPRPAEAGSTEPPAADDRFSEVPLAQPTEAAQPDAFAPSSVLAQVAPLAESDIAAGTFPSSQATSVGDEGGAEAVEPDEPLPLVAAAEDPVVPELFTRATPLEVILGVFARLAQSTGIAIQETLLSLPPVFEDRRFEILPFEDHAVESVLELRSDVFSGFYLAHLHPDEVLLVYASRGRHIEFGPRRCELQPASSAETDEFHGAGLLGLAQDGEGNFVFIVTPDYQAWAQARARVYLEASARFLTPAELLVAEGELVPIWPDFEIEHLAES